MKSLRIPVLTILLAGAGLLPAMPATAAGSAVSTVGVSGYDLVSYHIGEKPLRGNGNHLAVHDGVTYLFTSEANRERFVRDPERYLPAFGGYCAFGVSVAKKFVGDPDVWEIVEGRLYLNLDNKIQGKWEQDLAANIKKAEEQWPRIRDRSASEL